MARIMAIDYGQKRTGLAVTDPMAMIANALTTVDTSTIFDYLESYLSQNDISTIVVGYPTTLSNIPAEIIPKIDKFIKTTQRIYPDISVVKYDERFTSKMAFDTMLQSGISRSKRRDKSLIDKISATIILQNYLESMRQGNL